MTPETDERGVVIPLVAASLVAIVLLVAIVVDFGAVRNIRHADQIAADAAAQAAGRRLLTTGSAQSACDAAWSFVRSNSASGTVTAPACSTAFLATCSPTVARTATGSIGPLTVEVVNPVPDSSQLLSERSVVGFDGTACGRVGVVIRRTATHLFGDRDTPTRTTAVARVLPPSAGPSAVGLYVTDPSACRSLWVAGGPNSGVFVYGDPVGHPGSIVVDSSAAACSGTTSGAIHLEPSARVITTSTPFNGSYTSYDTYSPGVIQSYALSGAPGTKPANASYRGGAPGQPHDWRIGYLRPDPPSSIDHQGSHLRIANRYNCRTATGCTSGVRPFVDDAIATYGPNTDPDPALYAPTSFACTLTNITLVVPAGNWRIPCATLTVASNSSLTFTSGNVLLQGNLVVSNDGVLGFGSGNLDITGTMHVTGDGKVDHGPATKTEINGAVTIDNAGVFNEQRSNQFVVGGHVNVTGDGKLRVNCGAVRTSPCVTDPSAPTLLYLRGSANFTRDNAQS